MIPMISDIQSYKRICNFVNKRIKIIPLIETPYSFFKMDEIITMGFSNQIHFGLNDLKLSIGNNNLFELLFSPVFIKSVKMISKKTKITGVGGVGSPLSKQIFDPKYILNECLNMGCNSVILSRSFLSNHQLKNDILKCLNLFEEQIKNFKYDLNYRNDFKKKMNL